jgi:hypothetical protein
MILILLFALRSAAVFGGCTSYYSEHIAAVLMLLWLVADWCTMAKRCWWWAETTGKMGVGVRVRASARVQPKGTCDMHPSLWSLVPPVLRSFSPRMGVLRCLSGYL